MLFAEIKLAKFWTLTQFRTQPNSSALWCRIDCPLVQHRILQERLKLAEAQLQAASATVERYDQDRTFGQVAWIYLFNRGLFEAFLAKGQHDFSLILATVLEQYQLPLDGDHGLYHWARVWTNGHAVGERNGADLEVVSLFALFHDACRENEFHDPGHGLRGGQLSKARRAAGF